MYKTWNIRKMFLGVSSCLISMGVAAAPAISADRIVLSYGILEFYISTSDIETYIETGESSEELDFYLKRLDPEENWLRNFLGTQYSLPQYLDYRDLPEHVSISLFLYSPLGEMILEYAGSIIRTESNLSGFHAIRGSLILSAASPEGLTPINVIRYYPTESIRLDLRQILPAISDLRRLASFDIESNQTKTINLERFDY